MFEEELPIFLETIVKHGSTLDLVAISGDYYDHKLNYDSTYCKYSIDFMHDVLKLAVKYNFKVRIIQGTKTHDYDQLDNFRHFEDIYIENFKIIKSAGFEEIIDNVNILYVPEEYVNFPDEYYNEFHDMCVDGAKFDLIFGHGTFEHQAFASQIQESEREISSAPVFMIDDWIDNVYGGIFFGHIHNHSSYKNKIFYNGSYSRWGFGEEKPKGFLLIDYDEETTEISTEFIENYNALTYKTVDLDKLVEQKGIEGSIDSKMELISEVKEKYDNIRLIFSDDNKNEDLQVIRENFSNDESLRIKSNNKIKSVEKDEKFDFVTNGNLDMSELIKKYAEVKYPDRVKDIDVSKERIEGLLYEEDDE